MALAIFFKKHKRNSLDEESLAKKIKNKNLPEGTFFFFRLIKASSEEEHCFPDSSSLLWVAASPMLLEDSDLYSTLCEMCEFVMT